MPEEWVELTSINEIENRNRNIIIIDKSYIGVFTCNRLTFLMGVTTVIGFISLLFYAIVNADQCDFGDHKCSEKLRLKILLIPFVIWILSIIIAIIKGIHNCYKSINC